MTTHTHRADPKQHKTIGWTYCVAPVTYGPTGREHSCNGVTHGAVVHVDRCFCGAERRIETNGRHERSSGWITGEEE